MLLMNKYNISGICGYPGEPISAQNNIESDQKTFKSGDIVSYQCVDFLSYRQERMCLNGQWTGSQARCGYGVDNDILKIVIRSCMTDEVVTEYDLKVMHKNVDKFANSFSTDRYSETPIRVQNSTCFRWHLYFTNRSHLAFIRADFATIFESISKSNRVIPIVSAYIKHNKTSSLCQIEAQKKTESETPLIIDLIRMAVAEVYGSAEEPACGMPELPIGVGARVIKEHQLYELQVFHEFNANLKNSTQMHVRCSLERFIPSMQTTKQLDQKSFDAIDYEGVA
ncbi:unnamed protein product [Oppiella nova]|uniref:Sushi domain-containing protein n=1 Tax=Oppiella nova TaxID=334625 RepID=A0A7R9LRR7_9ACAR|nr:unnamed protein product [Oppiella nova]CAG2165970.1 unnamed protein product [Oppiella nova]